MLFKGTERFPKGQIDRLVLLAGGQSNAETSEDSTHYWFAFPSERWELALAIEADRMRGARFDPAEVEVERRVIVEERARELNSPQGRLDQTHLALTYLRHPYRNPILGWPEDIARDQRRRLEGVLPGPLPPGRGGPGRGRRRRSRSGPRPDLQPLRRCTGRQVATAEAGLRSSSPTNPVDATSSFPTRNRRRGAFSAGAPCRGPIVTRRFSTCSPISFVAAGDRGSGNPWSRPTSRPPGSKTAHAAAQRAGQFFIQLEAAPGADSAAIEQRITAELLVCANGAFGR